MQRGKIWYWMWDFVFYNTSSFYKYAMFLLEVFKHKSKAKAVIFIFLQSCILYLYIFERYQMNRGRRTPRPLSFIYISFISGPQNFSFFLNWNIFGNCFKKTISYMYKLWNLSQGPCLLFFSACLGKGPTPQSSVSCRQTRVPYWCINGHPSRNSTFLFSDLLIHL